MYFKKYKRPALAILAGLGVIMIINTLLSFIVFQQIRGMQGMRSTVDTFIYNRFALTIVAFLTPIVGGVVVGYLAQKKGWLYGGILAVIIKIFSLILISTVFFYPQLLYGAREPNQLMYLVAKKNLVRQLFSFPFSVLFVAWAGWIGEKIAGRNLLKKM